jgi:hypothetical protein
MYNKGPQVKTNHFRRRQLLNQTILILSALLGEFRLMVHVDGLLALALYHRTLIRTTDRYGI